MQRVYVGIEDAEESAHALRWAIELVEAVGEPARVHAIHVLRGAPQGFLGVPSHVPPALEEEHRGKAEDELEQLVRDVMSGTSVNVDARVVEGNPAGVLLDLAQDADLLVLGATRKGRLHQIVLGSTSTQCVTAGVVPVAIIPST